MSFLLKNGPQQESSTAISRDVSAKEDLETNSQEDQHKPLPAASSSVIKYKNHEKKLLQF